MNASKIVDLFAARTQKQKTQTEHQQQSIDDIIGFHVVKMIEELRQANIVPDIIRTEDAEFVKNMAWVMSFCKAAVYQEAKLHHPFYSYFNFIKHTFNSLTKI
jgi:hypothetical protein